MSDASGTYLRLTGAEVDASGRIVLPEGVSGNEPLPDFVGVPGGVPVP